MKTIIIQIQVPDGTNVNVTQGGGGGNGRGSSEFTPRPDPDYPEGLCPECGQDNWRMIKAGFSKTKTNPDGSPKRFNAFYVCDTKDCDGKPGDAVAVGMNVIGDDLPF